MPFLAPVPNSSTVISAEIAMVADGIYCRAGGGGGLWKIGNGNALFEVVVSPEGLQMPLALRYIHCGRAVRVS